jgi:ligand-binding sensor domain-containing protein
MKKLSYFLFAIIQLLQVSCQKEILSVLDDIQISNHILNGYYVTSIAFDSDEFAWIGTFKQGLIKYDGTITRFDKDNSSLPDSFHIKSLIVDKNDNIWIGSNKGLVKFNKKEFIFYDKSNAPLITDNVYALTVDMNNNIWFTSCMFRTGGFIKYDGDNWNLFTPQNSELPGSLISDMLTDNQNNIWITINEGENGCSIVKISGEKMTIYGKNEIGIAPYYFNNLASSRNNQIYASIDYSLSSLADNSRPNIISFNGSKWKINNPIDEKGKSLGYVSKIAVDLNGNIWTETSKNGIAVYNGHKWIYDKDKLSLNSMVHNISVDSKNNIWFGCSDGIYIVN